MPCGFADAMSRFDFRGLHPLIFMGTASDRYAGWLGQVYSAGRYDGRITSRRHTVGGKSFTEKVLPVESVGEYFQHFRVLELDFTFYERRDCVIRLMTPRGMRYEQAYGKAHPFDSLVPGMLDPVMIEDTARLMKEGAADNARIFVIVNNRSGGNAPLIARQIACSYMGGSGNKMEHGQDE